MDNKIDQIASSVECQDERIELAPQSQLEFEKIIAINNLTRAVLIIAQLEVHREADAQEAEQVASVRKLFSDD